MSKTATATSQEFLAHVTFVENALAAAKNAGLETINSHASRVNNALVWHADRFAQQERIIAILRQRFENVPCERLAMILGGLGGSGKGAIQRHPANPLHVDRYAVVDPDEVKKLFAEFDMIPHVDGLSPMEASPLIHEEASDVAKRFAAVLQSEGRNIIWDITMASIESVMDRYSALRDAQYAQIDAAFVDSEWQRAYERAQRRHRKGQESYLQGVGFGGRIVPLSASEWNRPQHEGFNSRNAETFATLRDLFDNTVVFNADPIEVLNTTGQRFCNLEGF